MTRLFPLARWLMILVVLSGLFLTACSLNGDDDVDEPEAVAEPDDEPDIEEATGPETIAGVGDITWPSVTIEEILVNPDEFIGEVETVHGEVERVIEPKAIVLENEGERLLVVGQPDVFPPAISEGVPGVHPTEGAGGVFARATGPVRRFNIDEIEQELGLDFAPELYEEYVDEPVIIADEVAAGAVPLSAVLNDLDSLTGVGVNVIGRVGEVFSPQAFMLRTFDTDQGVLVVMPFPAMPPERADLTWVRLVATVIELNDANRDRLEAEFPFLLNDPAFEGFAGQHILIGDILEVVAPTASVRFEDVIEQPAELVDQTVTITGQVLEVVSPQAVILAGLPEADVAGAELAVFGPARIFPADLASGDTLVVTGTVNIFDVQTPLDLLGEPLAVEFNPAAFAEFDDEPVIVARAAVEIPVE